MEHLGASKEVVREVRAILEELFDLLQWGIKLHIREAAKLAGHKTEIVRAGDRKRLQIGLGHRVVGIRIDPQEGYSVHPKVLYASINDVPGGVAVHRAAGGV